MGISWKHARRGLPGIPSAKSGPVLTGDSAEDDIASNTIDRASRIDGFFLNESGTRITGWALQYTWVKLTRQVGLRGPRARRGPRMHDMRHRFAVEALLGWYRRGLDAARRLPILSAYLGHVHVADTYWYLEAVPELLERAAQRLDHPDEVRP
jgi:integrase